MGTLRRCACLSAVLTGFAAAGLAGAAHHEGDAIHGIVCQPYEAHRTATLVVLDTDWSPPRAWPGL